MSRPAYLDPVVEEVRERGCRLTARYDNDVWKLFAHFKQQQAEHPDRYVSESRVVRVESQRPSDTEAGPTGATSP